MAFVETAGQDFILRVRPAAWLNSGNNAIIPVNK